MKLTLAAPLLFLEMLCGQSSGTWHQIGQTIPRLPVESVLIADPANEATVYATARGLLFKSTDGSDSWSAVSGVTGVYSLLIDATNSAILYAGTSHGVLKSTDGGSTWTGANAGLPQGWPAWAQVLTIDPANPSVLYVQKWSGVFKSTDGGRSWNALNARFYASQGAATPLPDFQIQKLVVDPAHAPTMYATPGLFKSTDGGATWYPVSIMGAASYCCKLLAFDPATSTIYAVYSDLDKQAHIAKSTDQGATWTPAGRGFPDGADTKLVFDPKNTGTIYAPYIQLSWSGAPPAFGLVKSTDGGEIWAAIDTPIPGSYIASFVVDGNSTLYASYRPGGIFKSTDGGENWRSTNASSVVVDVPSLAIDPAKPNIIYALAGVDGVFKSDDSGANWTPLSALPPPTAPGQSPRSARSLAIDSGNSNILYAWAPCGLFKSIDAGASWQSNASGPPVCGTDGFLSIDPNDSNTLYLTQSEMAEPAGWLYKTADGGISWRSVWQSQDFLLALAIDPTASTTIYAGTNNGLLKTTDGGSKWIHTGLHPVVNVLAINPLNPNVVYAATTSDDFYPFPAGFAGLFKSIDAGASWSAMNSGLETLMNTGAPITALVLDPANPDVVYAGTSGNGVFRTTDGGDHWCVFTDGLTNLDVHVLALAPGTPDLLFASTSGGLFVFPLFQERLSGRRK